MAGIYIHIPFCKQACYYCDFHFSTNQLSRENTIQAIGRELLLQKDYLGGEEIQTIYFGGGTPSILSEKELDHLLDVVHSQFAISPAPEVTLEANPDDLTMENLRQLRRAGINRLSIGIQSFDDEVLRYLNRAHDSVMASRCVHNAHEAGFDNISVDLIYAIPGLDNARWREAIDKALLLNPQHISSYALTIEEKTVFGRWAVQGKVKVADDDAAAHQLQMLVEILETHGFEQYEVSNFSRAGFQSQHNSNYWKNKSYLGVGPSAHSYNGLTRQYNISNNHLYVQALQSLRIPSSVEILTRADKINEYLLTSLRTAWGVNLTVLRQDYGFDPVNTHQQYVRTLVDRNLATIKNDTLVLSKSGLLLADKIASDLFVIAP